MSRVSKFYRQVYNGLCPSHFTGLCHRSSVFGWFALSVDGRVNIKLCRGKTTKLPPSEYEKRNVSLIELQDLADLDSSHPKQSMRMEKM